MFSLFFLLQANTPPANPLDIYLSKLVETKFVETNIIIQERTNETSDHRIKIPPFIKKLFPKLTDLLDAPLKNLPILLDNLEDLFKLFTGNPNFPKMKNIKKFLLIPLRPEILSQVEDNNNTLLEILKTGILSKPFANMNLDHLDESGIIQSMVNNINAFTGTSEFRNILLKFYQSYLKKDKFEAFTNKILEKIKITTTTYRELTEVEKSFLEILRFYTYAYLEIGKRIGKISNRPRVERLLTKLQNSIIDQVVFTYLIYSYSVLGEDVIENVI